MSEENLNENIELPQRVNPFCVISKQTFIVTDINGEEHGLHEIQTNSAWSENPYGDSYAVVPDDMVLEIMETRGFCDIVLNKDGTEVVGFTAREIPEIPEEEPEPSLEEQVAELRAQNEMLMTCILEMSEYVYA